MTECWRQIRSSSSGTLSSSTSGRAWSETFFENSRIGQVTVGLSPSAERRAPGTGADLKPSRFAEFTIRRPHISVEIRLLGSGLGRKQFLDDRRVLRAASDSLFVALEIADGRASPNRLSSVLERWMSTV